MKGVKIRSKGEGGWSRAVFMVSAAVFIALFQRVYIEDISPVFSYMGMSYNDPGIFANSVAWVLGLVPAAVLPLRLKRPSDFILWLLYICVYIPSMFVPFYIGLRQPMDVVTLDVTLMAGLISMVLMLRREARPFRFNFSNRRVFWITIWALFIVFSAWIVWAFGGSLRLVSLSDVYSSGLRFESREIFAQSNVGYALMMMYGAVNPILLALGLQNRKKLLVLAGVSGQLLCYSAAGGKVIIFSLGVIFVQHTVLRRHMRRAAQVLMLLSITLLAGAEIAGRVTNRITPAALVLDGMVSRTMVIPGQLMAEYEDFFEDNPHLHLAGTKPFSWVLPPPPEGDVIFAITDHYEGDTGATSNASFWAQDGIANFGLLGIVLVSFLTAAVLRTVDRISACHDPCFAAMVFSFAGFNLSNGTLTIELLSGGLMLSMFLMMLAEQQTGIGSEMCQGLLVRQRHQMAI